MSRGDKRMKKLILSSLLVLSAPLTLADDTEIYTGTAASSADPNVIFLFDTSGSMNNSAIGQDGTYSTRIEVSKDAAKTIISGLSNMNIGIMQFDYTRSGSTPINSSIYKTSAKLETVNRNYGGLVVTPVATINDESNLNNLLYALDKLEGDAYTPLVEAYDEAARYMRGEDVKYGKRYGYGTCSASDVPVGSGSSTDTTRTQVCIAYKDWWGRKIKSRDHCEAYDTVSVETRGGWEDSRECVDWDSYTDNYGSCTEYGYYVTTTTTTTDDDDSVSVYSCSSSSTEGYFYVSNSAAIDTSTGKYISPIQDSCQANHIIVFTDGEANQEGESDDRIHTLLDEIDSSKWSGYTGVTDDCNTTWGSDYSCMEELAYYLYQSDNIDDSDLTTDHDPTAEGEQRIITHTVGGFLSSTSSAQKVLNRTASYGGGIAATASDYDSLVEALQTVFNEIASSSGSFTAPSVAVNALNRLENSDELYYTIFEPATVIGWNGNLKRYKLGSDGEIYDANDVLAVDTTTGFFSDNARSFWTLDAAAPDGDEVTAGGASSRLSLGRNIYTHLSTESDNSALNTTLITEQTSGGYAATDGVTQSLFGATQDSDEFLNMLMWASGIDVDVSDTTPRYQIEDPLHSQPIIIHYGVMADGETLDSTVYFGTNSGYLHAIDSNKDNPQERFAFIPEALLPNIYDYYVNNNEYGKSYGMDGPISYYLDEADNTGEIKSVVDDNDHAYLYAGMRRGGRNYYALDISDRDNPVFMWQITGGSGDFTELGQTWSEMTPIDIDPSVFGITSDEETIKALVFGGGYDADEDDNNTTSSTRISHDVGNAIYIVDAQTGDLIWKASPAGTADLTVSDMTNSFVGDITPVDNDGDGDIDILYAADMGGRIWRFDINHFSGSNYRATIIADLNTGTTTGNTRFYTSVDVSYAEGSEGDRYQIAIGSGYRAHPLNEDVTDHFYVINDFMVNESTTALEDLLNNYSTLSRSDLVDYADYNKSSTTVEQKKVGVYFELPTAYEKVLSNSLTADNIVYFTSYIPPDSTATSSNCTPATGNGRLYTLAIGNAASSGTSTSDNSGGTEDGVTVTGTDLTQSGIPAEPVLVYPPDDENKPDDDDDECVSKAILVGSESISLNSCATMNKSFWHEL